MSWRSTMRISTRSSKRPCVTRTAVMMPGGPPRPRRGTCSVMSDPDNFERVGSRGFHRPAGVVTFEQAVEIVAVGIGHAQELGLKDLLVNVHGLSGFAVPTTFGRYAFAVRWAQ